MQYTVTIHIIQILHPLTLIINQSLTTSIFPDNLKISKILSLYKKGDNQIYQIISQQPYCLRYPKYLKELSIYNQLFEYFYDNKLLSVQHYGFRRG